MGFQHVRPYNRFNLSRYFAVQTGEHTLSGTDDNVTIAAVDMTKAVLEFSYEATDSTDEADRNMCQGEITSSTTLRFRKFSSTGSVIIRWFVWEAKPHVPLTVQRFTKQCGNSGTLPRNETITSVSTSNSFVLVSQRAEAGTDPPKQNNIIRAKLTSATNVECDMDLTNSVSVTCGVQAVRS